MSLGREAPWGAQEELGHSGCGPLTPKTSGDSQDPRRPFMGGVATTLSPRQACARPLSLGSSRGRAESLSAVPFVRHRHEG